MSVTDRPKVPEFRVRLLLGAESWLFATTFSQTCVLIGLSCSKLYSIRTKKVSRCVNRRLVSTLHGGVLCVGFTAIPPILCCRVRSHRYTEIFCAQATLKFTSFPKYRRNKNSILLNDLSPYKASDRCAERCWYDRHVGAVCDRVF
jgi:hypothetical protein